MSIVVGSTSTPTGTPPVPGIRIDKQATPGWGPPSMPKHRPGRYALFF
jgi:hypothetical protein